MRNWLFTIPLRLRSILRRGRVESELSEEFEFHLQCRTNAEIASGKAPEEARRAALRAMVGMEQHKESCRDARHVGLVDSVRRDLHYACRSLWKSPAFTIAATVTLALAIGVNTAMFSVVKGVLARPLPYNDPDRLVWISMRLSPRLDASRIKGQDYLEWRKRASAVAGLAAFDGWDLNLTGVEQPERLNGARVSSSFLPLLGVQPALGRSFEQPEDMPGAEPVVMLSSALWRRLYQADPTVLGRSIVLDGAPRTIVGVLPPSFEFPGDDAVDLLVPLSIGVEPNWAAREAVIVSVLGRLPAGVPPDRAALELREISRGAPSASDRAALEVEVEPLRQKLVGDNRLTVLLLLGASGMILLIACGNVMHLSLVRSLARQQEISIRKALGAHRARLVRQLLTESAVLTAMGSSAGLLLAGWILEAVRAQAPFGNAGQVGIDPPALYFTLATAVFTTLASGLGPAFAGSRGELGGMLKGGHGLEGGRSRRSPYVLAITEVSLTIILLSGAALLLRSLDRLTSEEPGFQPRNVLTARVAMSRNRPAMRPAMPSAIPSAMPLAMPPGLPSLSTERAFLRGIEERLGALPGVLSVATSNALPLVGTSYAGPMLIEGRPEAGGPLQESVTFGVVSGSYFRTMGIPVLQGRSFLPSDLVKPGSAVVVNEAFVRRYGGGENLVGRKLTGPGGEFRRTWRTIVGVVGDVRRYGLAQEPSPEVFLLREAYPAGETFISIRTATPPLPLAGAVRRALADLDPDRPVFDIATMEDRLAAYTAPWRLHAFLLSAFAGLALCMTAVGVYGVMSYLAARRTKEIGIRMALGAGRGRLVWLVTRRGMGAVLAGIAAGVAGALALTRFMAHLLYETEPMDPQAFLAAAGVLACVGLMAVLVPVCRALGVDAVKTLREG